MVLVLSQQERAAAMRGKSKTFYALIVSFLIALNLFNVSFAYDSTEIAVAKRKMIAESIANYRGNCPCPYNTASNGSSCGKRSAYSRPGGATPLCYDTDISEAQAIDWLRRQK